MSRAKTRRPYTKPQSPATNKEKPKRRLKALPYFPLLFLTLWIFGAFVYGDVFYMSQQWSYFAFDKTLMYNVLSQSFWLFNVVGRFLLLSYHYPILGSALLALMLTLSVWLLDYIIGFKGKLHWIAALLPFAFLGYFVYLDYSINYMRETSVLMSIPAAFLVLTTIAAVAKRIVTGKKNTAVYRVRTGDSNTDALLTCAVIAVAFTAITIFCLEYRENYIKTCRMQRQLEQSDWYAMIDEAKSARRPARSVAAYYVLALAETGQLENRMFEIPYDFPKTTVKAADMKENDGVMIYSIDCDFYAGLVNSSYHASMETFVKCGPLVFLLKRLIRASAMNGEKALCERYITALRCCLVENDFVERYSAYAENMDQMYREPEFTHVALKMPLHDTFEQNYRAPYFIGYNVALTEGRSSEALRASIMACLYTKDTDFMMRAQLLRDSVLSPYVEQAIMLQGLHMPQALDNFHFDKQLNLSRLKSFVNEAKPWLKEERTGFKKLKDTWLNFYPFYLYFQNIPTDEQTAQHEHESEKGGVN